jgi:hypothetical protein
MTTDSNADILKTEGNQGSKPAPLFSDPPPYTQMPQFTTHVQDTAPEIIYKLANLNISECSIDELDILTHHLQALQAKAKGRQFWTKVSYAFNGFVDGMFDIVAPLGITGAVVAAVYGVGLAVSLLTPPVGWAILGALLGVGAIFGGFNAYKEYQTKSKKLAEDDEKYTETLERIEALKKFKKSKDDKKAIDWKYIEEQEAYYQSIIERLPTLQRQSAKEKISALYSKVKDAFKAKGIKGAFAAASSSDQIELVDSKPPKDDSASKWGLTDKLDAGSRHGRNSVMLGFFISQPIIVLAGAVITWPIIVASFVLFLIQSIPRYLEKIWIDEPRAKEQAALDKVLEQTKRAQELEFEQNVELALEVEMKLASTNIISEALTEDISTDSALLLGARGDTESTPSDLQTEISEYRSFAAANAVRGIRLAGGIGMVNGALHPIAWCAILGLVVFLAIGGPLAPAIIIGGFVAAGLIALYVAPKIAERARAKEREAQDKQNRAINNYASAATDCERKIALIQAKTATLSSNDAKFERLYQKYRQSIKEPEKAAKEQQLDDLYKEFRDARSKKLAEIAENDQTFIQDFNGFKVETTHDATWSTGQRGMRDFRDSVSFWDKPFTALVEVVKPLSEFASYAGGLLFSAGLGIITLIPAIYKKTQDNKRDKITAICENKFTYLENTRRSYWSKKLALESPLNDLETKFKQSANNIIYESAPGKPVLFSHIGDEPWIRTPPETPPGSRIPSPSLSDGEGDRPSLQRRATNPTPSAPLVQLAGDQPTTPS